MQEICNPVLSGFHPDPSILRVGDWYYLATSTFEWFPGVRIHRSRDLVHWELTAAPLNRISQLNLEGVPISGGVWAPCLSYAQGTYYLIYTDVKVHSSSFRDTHNYLVTSKSIEGGWSDPVFLNSSGFDPSLFHDADGRKWLVNMKSDFRAGKNTFHGIVLQEYSTTKPGLVGPIYEIYRTAPGEIAEGPHLYQKDGYYYLMLAVGGTGLEHGVRLARAKCLLGPYEEDPSGDMLTSRYDATLPLQKAGHGSLVQTQTGEWYLAHLAARPIPANGRCPLGRETCLQKVEWNAEGWLRLTSGGITPQMRVPAPALPAAPPAAVPVRDDFDAPVLNPHFQSLRVPLGEDQLSLSERPGFLRLKGGESLFSWHRQSLVARRQQAFSYQAETYVEFSPDDYTQMAGLICLYDTMNYYYLCVTWDEQLGKVVKIMAAQNAKCTEPVGAGIPLPNILGCRLRARVSRTALQFFYATDEANWKQIGPRLDASTLSDEYCQKGCFTGAFVGLCCQDLSGCGKPADFDYFEYREMDDSSENPD